MFGSTMDELEELGSCFVEPVGGFIIAYRGGDRVELPEGHARLQKILGLGQ